MNIKLYNTLTGKKEIFSSISQNKVSMYNCGPTVYGQQHIGNLSMFVFTDILRRSLEYCGYKIRQVINITDFGHLSGDNHDDPDRGEDKMTRGLKREGLSPTLKNMRLLADKYANIFFQDLSSLNIEKKKILFPYASDYIEDQIKMIQTLEEKGFAYINKEGVYFDTSKFPDYGKLGNIKLLGLREGVRVKKGNKKHLTDFILWKNDEDLGWQSSWGLGFPGWHIECSAMAIKLLGEQIDIHTGGIEHIPIHHNNEIAQSESATGKKPFSRFWLHRAHIKVDDAKIAKSDGTAIYLDDLRLRRIHPLSFRYWLLTSHYRTPANFTWEAIIGAQNAFEKIISSYSNLPDSDNADTNNLEQFEEAMSDDLNTPKAIALFQEVKSKYLIKEIDKILGLNIEELSGQINTIPEEILEIKKERDVARRKKAWSKSDELREEIEREGYILEDKADASSLRRSLSSLI